MLLRKVFFMVISLFIIHIFAYDNGSIITIKKEPTSIELKFWGDYQALRKDKISSVWNSIMPMKDINWGAGFGYIVDNKNYGPLIILNGDVSLKTGSEESEFKVIEANVLFSSNFLFGIRELPKPTNIIYFRNDKGINFEDVLSYLEKENNIKNFFFIGFISGKNFTANYLYNAYEKKFIKDPKDFIKTFTSDYATIKVCGYYLNNKKNLKNTEKISLPNSLIFIKTCNYIIDLPILTNLSEYNDFSATLHGINQGFVEEIPTTWDIYRGILFIYKIDKIK